MRVRFFITSASVCLENFCVCDFPHKEEKCEENLLEESELE